MSELHFPRSYKLRAGPETCSSVNSCHQSILGSSFTELLKATGTQRLCNFYRRLFKGQHLHILCQTFSDLCSSCLSRHFVNFLEEHFVGWIGFRKSGPSICSPAHLLLDCSGRHNMDWLHFVGGKVETTGRKYKKIKFVNGIFDSEEGQIWQVVCSYSLAPPGGGAVK